MLYLGHFLRLFVGVSVFYIIKKLFFHRFYRNKQPNKKYPPGPLPFPLVGSFPYIIGRGFQPCLARWDELAFKYGKVMSFNFGPYKAVFINDHNVLKEAFQAMDCCGRPRLETLLEFHGKKLLGIIIQDGENWKQLRRFTLKHLREYGFGKNSTEVVIERECEDLVKDLREQAGRPMSTNAIFNIPIVNVLWEIIGGQRLSYDDPVALRVVNALITVAQFSLAAVLAFFYPKVSKAFPRLTGYDVLMKTCVEHDEFIGDFVKIRKLTHKLDDENDFTDVFLNKIKSTSDSKSDFYGKRGEENLVAVIGDLFLAGTETSSTTLRWLLLYFAVYPEAQKKMQDEIDRVLGEKFPTLDQRPLMPYTEAVLMETMRKSSLLPLGLLHSAMTDVTIGGYFVPKDTLIVNNIHAIHHNPEVWDEPNEFKPERFLSPDGQSVIKHEAFVAFSVGKRACPGEQLARDELFIFASRIFQQFNVSWDPSGPKPTLTAHFSTALSPKPHNLILTERKPRKMG